MRRVQFVCDICGALHVEDGEGDGAPGWGQLYGIALDGVPNPLLCPAHLGPLADLADTMKQRIKKEKA